MSAGEAELWKNGWRGLMAGCLLLACAATGCRGLATQPILASRASSPITLVSLESPPRTTSESSIPPEPTSADSANRESPTDAPNSTTESSLSCTATEGQLREPLFAGHHSECCNPYRRPVCAGCDFEDYLPTLWRDARGVVNWNNGLILMAAGGVAIALRESDADREVREQVAHHPMRWGSASQTLGKLGNVEVQLPVLLGMYGLSIANDDPELHDVTRSLMNATTITGLSAVALKLAFNTDRPSQTWNDGHYGFPSYHTASSFAIAAVLDEYYGAKAGLPAYALATAIGFSRLDEQDHDLSDVLFGGTLGFVIGKAIAGQHLCGNSKIRFAPYVHPTNGSPGICCEAKF